MEPVVEAVGLLELIRIGVPDCPISPEPEVKFKVVPLNVKLPERVMVPVPLALTLVVVPPPTLPATVMAPLAVVARVTVPEVTVTLPEAVSPVPPVRDMVVLPPVTVPVSSVPRALKESVFVPSVIVCPAAV